MITQVRAIFLLILFLQMLSFSISAQMQFQEVSNEANLTQQPRAGSIAIGDYNNDGYEDMYVSYSQGNNHLFKNRGDGTFEEVGTLAGVAFEAKTKTAIWGDLDNDGDLDLYVGNRDFPDRIFKNNGDETFTDISLTAGINNLAYPLSVNMADLNGDGYLDIYVANLLLENILYLNNGDLTFTDYTQQSGATDLLSAMGVVIFDYDQDGDQDLYLTHDADQANILYKNDGQAHFTNVAVEAGVATESNAMGVDIGDFDNDGDSDIYIANLYENILLKNNGDGTFSNISESAGIDDDGMGWGVSYLDYDNDGLLDIYVANDSYFSPKPNILYKNIGNNTFIKDETSGAISSMYAGYAAVAFDFNMDGQQDIAVANKASNDYIELFQNPHRGSNWIGIKLLGIHSNRNAVGAKVRVIDTNGKVHFKEMTAGSGWASQNSGIFHFGLGSASISEIIVEWPSGLVQPLAPQTTNQYYTVVEGQNPTNGISFDTNTSSTNKIESEHSCSIFPNPNNGHFYLSIKNNIEEPLFLELMNIHGETVYSEKIQTPKTAPFQINVPNGIYWLKIQNSTFYAIEKVLIKN